MADDWRWAPLAAVCDRVSVGHVGLTSEFFCGQDEGVPLLRSQNVRPGRLDLADVRYVTQEFHQKSRKSQLESGDILFVRVGQNRGDCCIVPAGLRDLNCANVVFARPRRSFSRFLGYYFQSPVGQQALQSISTGSAQGVLNTKSIASLEVPLPPITEAEAIAHILGTLDDKIELNRRMNETLEAMARALFKSWFVDFDPVRAKAEGRDHGLPKPLADLFQDSFEDSDLGEVPRGWSVATLGDVCNVIDCLHSKKPERRDSGRPLLQLSNIRDNGLIDMADTYLIDEAAYDQWTTRMEASEGDCVVTNVGRVGAVAQIPRGFTAALGRNMTGVRCKATFPFPTFIIENLLSEAMQDEMSLNTDSGTILDALNVRNIPRLRFMRASPQVLQRFEQLTRPLRTRMEEGLAQSRTLAALRDALLPKLISGQLQINADGPYVEKAPR